MVSTKSVAVGVMPGNGDGGGAGRGAAVPGEMGAESGCSLQRVADSAIVINMISRLRDILIHAS